MLEFRVLMIRNISSRVWSSDMHMVEFRVHGGVQELGFTPVRALALAREFTSLDGKFSVIC